MKANLPGEILELAPTSDTYCPTEFLHPEVLLLLTRSTDSSYNCPYLIEGIARDIGDSNVLLATVIVTATAVVASLVVAVLATAHLAIALFIVTSLVVTFLVIICLVVIMVMLASLIGCVVIDVGIDTIV